MPKPELYPIKKLIRIDKKMADDVDKFRKEQEPSLNFSEAIRRLVELGLMK